VHYFGQHFAWICQQLNKCYLQHIVCINSSNKLICYRCTRSSNDKILKQLTRAETPFQLLMNWNIPLTPENYHILAEQRNTYVLVNSQCWRVLTKSHKM
jgi:hypothetical protein